MTEENETILERVDVIHPTEEAIAKEVNKMIARARRRGDKLRDMRLREDSTENRYSAKIIQAKPPQPKQ